MVARTEARRKATFDTPNLIVAKRAALDRNPHIVGENSLSVPNASPSLPSPRLALGRLVECNVLGRLALGRLSFVAICSRFGRPLSARHAC